MRTIKFRGKCCHSDAWAFGNLVDYGEDECPEIQGFDVFSEGHDVWQEIEVEPDTIGQFTGLHDKNGKEIYEGDIIQHRRMKVIVKFWRGAYGYGRIIAREYAFVPFVGSDDNKNALQFTDGTVFDTDFCEVIGNIHDNLKLLKMKKTDERYPLIMTEEYWANSQLSVARYCGHIQFMGREYIICDKTGRDIFQLSAIAHRQGKEKAIEPGEPADLVLMSLLPAYRKLGRDRIIALIKEGKTEKEIKAIARQKPNDNEQREKNNRGHA